nr:extensin family protein [Sphingomonas japonica]
MAAFLIGAAFLLYAAAKNRPQDLPWTDLDLGQPVGMFTAAKLTALTGDFRQCRRLLDRAGVAYTALAPVGSEAQCGYADGVRLDTGGSRRLRFAPPGLGVSCPVAASLAMWEWNVVQPAAQRWLGQRVRSVEHFGSYNCRRLYGRDAGAWSEHATADAVDIAGFILADGTRITVAGDWDADGEEADQAAFLHAVRDGACDLFATTLSPDYNAAHRDHLHLDHAKRGAMRWSVCR